MSVETLSSNQRQVYDAIQAGKDKATIIRECGLTEGTFAAQCTRIKNKGIQLPGFPGHTGSNPSRQDVASGRSPRPAATGPGASKQVIDEAFQAGEATYDVETAIAEAQRRGDVHGDMATMHPMAIMGLTIQFMRLCGGRFHAHQILEDVYGAIRLFNADGPSADDVVESATKPFAPGSNLNQEDLDEFLGKVESVKGELGELLGRLKPDTAQTP